MHRKASGDKMHQKIELAVTRFLEKRIQREVFRNVVGPVSRPIYQFLYQQPYVVISNIENGVSHQVKILPDDQLEFDYSEALEHICDIYNAVWVLFKDAKEE